MEPTNTVNSVMESIAATKAPALPTVEGKEATVPETQASPAVAPEKKDGESARFAALAKKERALFRQMEEFKAQQAAIEKEKSEIAQFKGKYEQGKKNPLQALKDMGWSYDELTKFVLNDEKPTPETEIKSVKEQMEALKSEREAEKKAAEEAKKSQQEKEYQQQIVSAKEEIGEFLKENSDTYELTLLHSSPDEIYQLIEAHYYKTSKDIDPETGESNPKVLSFKEAADLVESHYEDRVKKTAETKKFKNMFAPPKEGEGKEAPKPAPSKTLSNSVNSSAPSMLPAKTEEERMRRALAAMGN